MLNRQSNLLSNSITVKCSICIVSEAENKRVMNDVWKWLQISENVKLDPEDAERESEGRQEASSRDRVF